MNFLSQFPDDFKNIVCIHLGIIQKLGVVGFVIKIMDLCMEFVRFSFAKLGEDSSRKRAKNPKNWCYVNYGSPLVHFILSFSPQLNIFYLKFRKFSPSPLVKLYINFRIKWHVWKALMNKCAVINSSLYFSYYFFLLQNTCKS